jgi:polar amino acid transport system substrate-binding protein
MNRLPVLGLALVLVLGSTAFADGLDRVKKSGVLRWGCDAEGGAPYVYKDAEHLDRYVGFEVELADALAASLGVRAERTQNAWTTLLPGLKRGDYDVALNGIEIAQERERDFLFSRPYYVSSLEVAIRKGEGPVPVSFGALKGKRVATLKESFAEKVLKDVTGIELIGHEGVVTPYYDLRYGRVDAVVLDFPIARYYGRSPEFETAPSEFGEARYGIAVNKGEEALVAALDRALDELIRSGKLREIYERYGVWNGATAELFHDDKIAKTPPVMLERFERGNAPRGLADRAKAYTGFLVADLIPGALMTLGLSLVGMAIAVGLGLVLALLRLYAPAPLRALSAIYIEGIRGTPLLIQIYIIFYALPGLGLNFPRFVAAVIALGLNYAAYEAENYRAGLTSISIGQTEAAHALGLTHLQTLRYVIVPQALRLVIPPVTNDFIALLKDSSIVSVIGMTELTLKYNELSSMTGDRIGLGLLVGGVYFFLGWPFAKLAAWLEARARRGRR